MEELKPCEVCGESCELGICEDCANVAFDLSELFWP